MIEPLRFNREHAPPYAISRPVFCGMCLASKKTRNNPDLASKFCEECPREFLCHTCDVKNHNTPATKDHVRRILVVGPGVKKRVLTRGDATSFPKPLDHVTIRLKSEIYHDGKKIHTEKSSYLTYQAGLSGDSVHVINRSSTQQSLNS